MGLDEIEKKIEANSIMLENLTKKIDNNIGEINKNREKIQHNTGALELLHTINSNSNKYFIIWIITFIGLLLSVAYNFYLLNDISQVVTEEVEQSNDSGNNNYIGRDGDISG